MEARPALLHDLDLLPALCLWRRCDLLAAALSRARSQRTRSRCDPLRGLLSLLSKGSPPGGVPIKRRHHRSSPAERIRLIRTFGRSPNRPAGPDGAAHRRDPRLQTVRRRPLPQHLPFRPRTVRDRREQSRREALYRARLLADLPYQRDVEKPLARLRRANLLVLHDTPPASASAMAIDGADAAGRGSNRPVHRSESILRRNASQSWVRARDGGPSLLPRSARGGGGGVPTHQTLLPVRRPPRGVQRRAGYSSRIPRSRRLRPVDRRRRPV